MDAKGMPVNEKTVKTETNCIAPENISAWTDGEYEFSPQETEHLKQCRKCSSLQKSYQILSNAVQKSVAVECPGHFAEHLRFSVKARLEKEQLKLSGRMTAWKWVTRVAALLILFGMIGYFSFKDGNPLKQQRRVVPDEITTAPRKIIAAELQSASVHEPYAGFTGSVDIRNTRLASTNGGKVRFSDDPSIAKVEKVAQIHPNINQIWLYEGRQTLVDLENSLRKLVEMLRIPLKSVKMHIAEGNKELKTELNINSYQAVQVSRAMKKAGYALISPVEPQPEQSLFAGTGREEVHYTIVLSPKGK